MGSVPSGPEEILQIVEPAARMTGFLVIDSTRLGPAFGGVRFRRYASEREALLDAMDLAASMTLKAALAGLPCGGGKIVVMERRGLRRARALQLVGRTLNALGGRFFSGPDYGMSRSDLARLRRVTAFAADEPPGAASGLAEATARGTIQAMRGAVAFAEGGSRPRHDLSGLTVALQGLGAVGGATARALLREGVHVAAADLDAAAVRRGRAMGLRMLSPARLASVPSDVFVPAALGGTIDEAFARRCAARIVCGPANNALSSPRAEDILRQRGIVFVPDPLVGAGALIAGALRHLESVTDAGPAIDRIGPRVLRVLREAARSRRRATEIVQAVALRRLSRGR